MRSNALLARLVFVDTFVDAVVVSPFYAGLRRVATLPLSRPRPVAPVRPALPLPQPIELPRAA